METNEAHGFFRPAHRQQLYNKMLDFLDRHIGAKRQLTP
ncbi:MAG: hypothetical protein ACTS5I_12740 [Rhodanobacter sp.]